VGSSQVINENASERAKEGEEKRERKRETRQTDRQTACLPTTLPYCSLAATIRQSERAKERKRARRPCSLSLSAPVCSALTHSHSLSSLSPSSLFMPRALGGKSSRLRFQTLSLVQPLNSSNSPFPLSISPLFFLSNFSSSSLDLLSSPRCRRFRTSAAFFSISLLDFLFAHCLREHGPELGVDGAVLSPPVTPE
jgi:hypothetical protein